MNKVLLCLSLLTLGGCSSLATSALSAFTEKPSVAVETEVVAGDKEQSVETGTVTKGDTKLEDVSVNGDVRVSTSNKGREQNLSGQSVTLNEGVKFWQAGLLAMLGVIFGALIGLFIPQLSIKRKYPKCQ